MPRWKLQTPMRARGPAEFDHRIRVGWARSHKLRTTWTNRHVNLKLRLRRFGRSVSMLFGLATVPSAQMELNTLDVIQRRMLKHWAGEVPKGRLE